MHQEGGWIAYIYGFDHPPPHFHVRAGEYRVKIEISTLDVLAGRLPRREMRQVANWASANETYLNQCWVAAESGEAME